MTITSGKDTNITGSEVKGDKVVANIGGNLNIASVQDTDNYTAKNQSSGFGLTTQRVDGKPLPAGNLGPINQVTTIGLTGSVSKEKTNSTYASVTEQAGIFAGKEGFDITVGKNTDLKGAVIDSNATPDKNQLTTGTLTWSDVQNKADYSASSSGVAYDSRTYKKGDENYRNQGLTPVIGMTATGNAESTTHSGIAPAMIVTIGNQKQDINTLNRDTKQSINMLGKIFDKQTVQEQQQLANLFGQLAFEQVHKIAKQNGWDESSSEKIALHAFVGGIMSDICGNGFASGALGAGLNEAMQKELEIWFKGKPDLHQWASVIIGNAASGTVGAATALSGTRYNGFSREDPDLDPKELRRIARSAKPSVILVSGSVGADKIAQYYGVPIPPSVSQYLSVGASFIYDPAEDKFYPGASVGAGAAFGALPVSGGAYALDFLDRDFNLLSGKERQDYITGKLSGIGYQATMTVGIGVTALASTDRKLQAIGFGLGLDLSVSVGNTGD